MTKLSRALPVKLFNSKRRWRPVVGYEGRYEVSDHGEVRSLDYMHTGQPQLLTPVRYKKYHRVWLYDGETETRKRRTVHRMVAEAFIPNPENKPTVNHEDGNTHNNHWKNLKWATHSEQTLHAVRVLGKGPAKGSASPHAKRYLVLHPDGVTKEELHGLKAWAVHRGLDESALLRTMQGKQRAHKGFILLKELS